MQRKTKLQNKLKVLFGFIRIAGLVIYVYKFTLTSNYEYVLIYFVYL